MYRITHQGPWEQSKPPLDSCAPCCLRRAPAAAAHVQVAPVRRSGPHQHRQHHLPHHLDLGSSLAGRNAQQYAEPPSRPRPPPKQRVERSGPSDSYDTLEYASAPASAQAHDVSRVVAPVQQLAGAVRLSGSVTTSGSSCVIHPVSVFFLCRAIWSITCTVQYRRHG